MLLVFFQIITNGYFIFEFVIRIWAHPKRIDYFCSIPNFLDFLAIFPFLLEMLLMITIQTNK